MNFTNELDLTAYPKNLFIWLQKSWKKIALVCAGFAVLYIIGQFIPIGFDWNLFFGRGRFPPFWMPWSKLFLAPFNLPAMFAITVLSMAIRVYQYRPRSPLIIIPVLISLPTLWVFFMGNVDGLVMLGLLLLPLGAPLVLLKPQLAGFALLAHKKYFAAAAVWVLISFIIWGFWPLNLQVVFTPTWRAEWQQDITLFPWGLIVAIPLLWLSRNDQDLLMAAGSFATPHLFPYHFIVLMPALARMKWYWALLTWLMAWGPLVANYVGPIGWRMGNLTGVCFWVGIYFSLPKAPPSTEAVQTPDLPPA